MPAHQTAGDHVHQVKAGGDGIELEPKARLLRLGKHQTPLTRATADGDPQRCLATGGAQAPEAFRCQGLNPGSVRFRLQAQQGTALLQPLPMVWPQHRAVRAPQQGFKHPIRQVQAPVVKGHGQALR